MGFIEEVAKAKNVLTRKDIDVAVLNPNARRSLSSANLPVYPVWFFAPARGIPRRIDINELRLFSRSAWVQMVKNAIKKAVLSTEWDIVVREDSGRSEEEFKDEILFVKHFLEHPNRETRQDFDYIISTILDDILDIDSGILFLNGEVNEPLKEIIAYDASSFLKEIDENGFLVRWWQYSFRHPLSAPYEFSPDKIVDFQMNKRTHNPYGFSPLQSVQQVVEVLDQATRYNKDFFEHNAIPSLLISIIGHKDAARKFKSDWLEQLEGENARIVVTNSAEAKVQQMALSNRDMEWLDGQKWYMHLVFAAYGLSPTEVGFTDSTGSKNVQEGQMKITVRNAHIPYLRLLSRSISRFVIPRILGEAEKPLLERTPLEFRYFPKDADMEQLESEGERADVASGILSINEVRARRGLEPFPSPRADNPFSTGSAGEEGGGVVDGEDDQEVEGEEAPHEDERPIERGGGGTSGVSETVVKEDILTPPESPTTVSEPPLVKTVEPVTVDAGRSYAEWFERVLGEWERQIIRAINNRLYKVPRSFDSENIFLKDFGDFLSALLRGFAVTPFLNLLAGVVKRTLLVGVEDAEEELDMNLSPSIDFHRLVDHEVQKQFNGYTLPDGKKWVGLRGVARHLQQKVYDRVRVGFERREMTDTIVDGVVEILDGVKRSRAASIVRTESARLVNEGKLAGYKAAGLGGKKEYVAFLDSRTTKLCRFLNGQRRGLDEPFDGPNGEQWMIPPVHVNCRSFIRYIRE